MSLDYRNIIAEPPYDKMGGEFREIFGKWLNDTVLENANDLNELAFGLFRLRLELAERYSTKFASQVTKDGRSLWKARFYGFNNGTCYSYATPQIDRTKRFFKWCEQVIAGVHVVEDEEVYYRDWNSNLADHPSCSVSVVPFDSMKVTAFKYEPRFTARSGGPFECRRIEYGKTSDGNIFYLFEHPRGRWIPQIRAEATAFWNVAWDENNDYYTRTSALASFEWLWVWMNPMMRSGALTMDALSLLMQKHIGVIPRDTFYHQDCEALLMPFDRYVEKRVKDMKWGFVYQFKM